MIAINWIVPSGFSLSRKSRFFMPQWTITIYQRILLPLSSYIFINPIKYNKTINFDYVNYSLMREWTEVFFSALTMFMNFIVNWIFMRPLNWLKDEIWWWEMQFYFKMFFLKKISIPSFKEMSIVKRYQHLTKVNLQSSLTWQ